VRPSSLLKRFATVDEVAAMATYLANALSSATNGAALRVDGGRFYEYGRDQLEPKIPAQDKHTSREL
jgi:enoyl-[acyl-carrier-protein] reductase (NADH)